MRVGVLLISLVGSGFRGENYSIRQLDSVDWLTLIEEIM